MNFTLLKIGSFDNDNDDDECCHRQSRRPSHLVKTDAFTVLPPLSPQIPGPPATPTPYRLLPPIVSRRRPSFVILQELGSRPPSRDPSPSGRVSPFRGCGFKPSGSRDTSPLRGDPPADDDKLRQSRSRLPVALKKASVRKVSKSVSPIRSKGSGIPVPLNRRISCSPNRTAEILAKMERGGAATVTGRPMPLKSSENLLGRRPAVSESDLKSALRRSNTNTRPRPAVSQPPHRARPPAAAASAKHAAKTPPISPDKKAPSIVTSPARRNLYLGKNEALKKSENGAKSGAVVVKPSPARPKTLPASSNVKMVAAKSKENLSPCSTTVPAKAVLKKHPSRLPRTPSRMPPPPSSRTSPPKKKETSKSTPKAVPTSAPRTETTGVPETDGAAQSNVAKDKDNVIAAAATVAATAVHEASDEIDEKVAKLTKVLPKQRVGRKALTTSNLLSALKKTSKEGSSRVDSAQHGGVDEKKELPHTDTSRSLPISIGATNMTDSSMTLIRTTTEPALAPVQPELINEIRSALNDASKTAVDEEAICVRPEVAAVDAAERTNVDAANAVGVAAVTADALPKKVDVEDAATVVTADTRTAAEQVAVVSTSPTPTPQIRRGEDSPRPVHVLAVTQIEEPAKSTEMTNTIFEIIDNKPEGDGEVQSVNASSHSDNRNGISKSSWLNESSQSEIMRKASVRKLKENPSTECLMSSAAKPPSRWRRFRSKCPTCWRRPSGTHPLQISTISTGSDAASASSDVAACGVRSCARKYLRCACCQCVCKSRRGRNVVGDGQKRGRSPQFRCLRLKNNFKNVFGKLSCCKKRSSASLSKISTITSSKIADSEVACVGAARADATGAGGGICGRCRRGWLRCFGLVCCVNSALCVKTRSKCGGWCACCKKCVCCANREKKVISEAERRKSTISIPRRRKWTRVLTDFPKLDTSFVEHGSIMRGAIPVLPVPLAWICLILNVFLPGFGTLSSGIFCLFVGKPRFSINDSIFARIGAFIVNLLVAGSQLFTVLFCLVGWGWSIWWGIMMLKMARKNKRIKLAQQQGGISTNVSPMTGQNRDLERGAVSNG